MDGNNDFSDLVAIFVTFFFFFFRILQNFFRRRVVSLNNQGLINFECHFLQILKDKAYIFAPSGRIAQERDSTDSIRWHLPQT